MNRMLRQPNLDPFQHPLDAILADVAINVQLPPGLHQLARDRYESVRKYIERPGSPLENLVCRFYPQGSMCIDATISARGTDDEYDLDVVAQLLLRPDVAPRVPLDLLEAALEGYPVERPITRQTRCITINYADGMHIDVTPGSRLHTPGERESHVFHAKPDQPGSAHFHVPMNAYGFAQWYAANTPMEVRFAFELARRYYEAAGIQFRADAEFDEVPDQTPLVAKNTATVALQLVKRFRNVQYAGYSGRIPPSVVLSFYAGCAAAPNQTLSATVIRFCRLMVQEIVEATARRQRLTVVNPVFAADVFTDRWPETIKQQEEWRRQVKDLADTIEFLMRNEMTQEELRRVLRRLFGDHVVSRSLKLFNEQLGRGIQGGRHSHTGRGSVFMPSKPAIITGAGVAASMASPARAHTFMGGVLW
jgi:hypothetical protein